MNTEKPRINSIRIRWEIDESPDLSWMESTISEDGKTIISSCRYTQKDLDEHPIRTRRYIREDMERLERFNSGDLWMLGCYTEAEITVNDTIQTIRSGGLWGIESDTDHPYRETIAGEEYDNLMVQLEALNVDMPRRRWVNGDYREDLKKEAINRMDNTETRRDSNLSQWVKVED